MSEIVVVSDADWTNEVRKKAVADYVGPLLANEYPGYRWRVEPDIHNGIVNIRCEHASGIYGYTLKPHLYYSETQWRAAVIKAGGEILERFHLSRKGLSESNYQDAMANRDFAGLIHPDM